MNNQRTTTRAAAFAAIIATVEASGIDGMEPHTDSPRGMGGSLHFSWDRARAVGCRLSIEDRTDGLRADVSWSSTGRSPAEARAAIVLYSAVADLACLIEAQWARTTIEDPS